MEPLPMLDEEKTNERCETCRFWWCHFVLTDGNITPSGAEWLGHEVPKGGFAVAEAEEHILGEPAGECRRFPPQLSTLRDAGNVRALNPDVYSDGWCGEWKAKHNPTE